MTEWWTYRPADLLMFSPRVYARLIEIANEALWPAQALGLAAVLALLWMAGNGRPAPRMALLLLAPAWAHVGLGFHARHYATINTGAGVFAAAFVLQALLWLALAAAARGLRWRTGAGAGRLAGIGLVAAALLYPLLAPLLDRPWAQAETFGVLPDPTVLASIGVLLVLRWPAEGPRLRRVALAVAAWAVPLLWCVIALMLQWTMHEALHGG